MSDSEVVGAVELEAALKSLGIQAPKLVGAEIRLTSNKIRFSYQSKARRHKKSGDLHNSIRSEYSEDGLEAVTGSDVPHAKFLELGTEPHFIKPKSKKALSWIAPNGDRVNAKYVEHPGTAAHPYLLTSFVAQVDGIEQRIYKRVEEYIERKKGLK